MFQRFLLTIFVIVLVIGVPTSVGYVINFFQGNIIAEVDGILLKILDLWVIGCCTIGLCGLIGCIVYKWIHWIINGD